MDCARLDRYGVLAVAGEDARSFLHAQLTNDIEHLAPERAALAGWCSPKGRLLASFLVISSPDGFLLQLARDLAPAIAKRMAMFVLRSKVKITDASEQWAQYGVWNADFAANDVHWEGSVVTVRVGDGRYVRLGPSAGFAMPTTSSEETWRLLEIQAGRPLITAATQDQFVPQMVNFEALGGVDFRKGCYPGQEIVARAQYRGQVKRRMQRMPAPAGAPLAAGQEYGGGTVVDSAGGEMLAVVPV